MSLRSHRLVLALPFTALFGLALVTGAPRQGEELGIQIEPVQGNVSFLIGGVGNTLVSLGEQGLLVCDTKLARDGDALDVALAEMTDLLPVHVVNTHWHGDHTGNNYRYGAAATVFAHENVRRRLAGDKQIGGRVATDTPPEALPDITYDDHASLHFNGEEIRLLHFPNAHTDGDSVVWFTGSGVVYMGDLYFQLGYPFVDVDSGGSVYGVIAGVEAMLEAAPEGTRFVPGHGVVTGAEELREYLVMLKTITERVEELVRTELSDDDIVAMLPTEGFDERWGGFAFVPPEKFVRAVLDGVRSK